MAAPKGNKYAIGNNGGRPAIFETPQDFAKACDDYFIYIKGEKHTEELEVGSGKKKQKEKIEVWGRYPEPATITGLVLFLGFAHRQSLDDYEKKQEFSDIIKRARTRVEYEYEIRLHGDKNTGSIFALKNMGWKDKTEQEIKYPEGVKVKHVYQTGNAPLADE